MSKVKCIDTLQSLLLGALGCNMIWNIKVMFAIDWYPQDKGFL